MGIDKILVVDNDFAFVHQLRSGLQKHGQFEIITAPNGKHALRLLDKLKISLVVTELDLPKLDGLELIAVLTQKYPNILSIVATAKKELTLKKPQQGDSLFSYLLKPYDHVRLHGEIIKVLDCLDEIQFKAGIFTSSILPLIYLTKKTCFFEIQSGSSKSGSFCFQNGHICNASCGDKTGQEALKEMLRWEPAKLWFKELPENTPTNKTDNKLTALMLQATGYLSPGQNPKNKTKAKPVNSVKQEKQPKPIQAPKQQKEVKQADPVKHKGQAKVLKQDEQAKQKKRPAPAKPVQPVISKPESPVQPISKAKQQPPCRVLIVDDSELIRKKMLGILAKDKSIQVVGEAENGKKALELIQKEKPDVITLDIKMPVMDGITALKRLMSKSPIPTIIFSSVALEGNAVSFDTIRLGAVDFIAKSPDILGKDMIAKLNEIKEKIHLASNLKVETIQSLPVVEKSEKSASTDRIACKKVVCMGGAEGGYAALLKIIPRLTKTLPATYFVSLHASPQHIDAFVQYLDKFSAIRIKRVKNNMYAEGATCYLSSSNEYVTLQRTQKGKVYMRVAPAPPSTESMAINHLLASTAKLFTRNSIGVLLSGSGNDGAEGLKTIVKAGGITILQNPEYCLYKDMVKNARSQTKKSIIIPETLIANAIQKICLHANKTNHSMKGLK